MPKLVIQFHPDGSVETLRNKAIDLRKLGPASVERISSVEFCPAKQQFYIRWLKGPRKAGPGYFGTLTAEAHDRMLEGQFLTGIERMPNGKAMYFDTYEDGVAHEIAEVNKMRLEGASFA